MVNSSNAPPEILPLAGSTFSDRPCAARFHLAALASTTERAARWARLTHRAGETHPLNAWLSRDLHRAAALVAVFAIVTPIAMATDLFRPTAAVIKSAHYPALFAGLIATSLVLRRFGDRWRRPILLVSSLLAAAYFSPVFAAISVAYSAALYWSITSRLPRAVKLGVVLASILVPVVTYVAALPSVSADKLDASLFIYVFVCNFTFRILYLLHELNASHFRRIPRWTDVLTYLLFAPFFIVLPTMICIPRFGRFVENLDKPMKDGESSAIRYALAALLAAGAFAALDHLLHPWSEYGAAAREHRWPAALVAGVVCCPVWMVLSAAGVGYLLTAMSHLLGIAVVPPIDHPLSAVSFLDWWRRWNVNFRDFLVDVFFYPAVMRCRRPLVALTLGCAGVFLVGSAASHFLVTIVTHHAYYHLPARLAEASASFVVVLAGLVLERRRLRTRRAPPVASPRLADPRTPLLSWAAAQVVVGARVVVTMVLVFATTRGAQDVTSHLEFLTTPAKSGEETTNKPRTGERTALEISHERE
jgi:D-alanyl-lipoteichoic acid acyltransferase DltB (MBOAT superfamily)